MGFPTLVKGYKVGNKGYKAIGNFRINAYINISEGNRTVATA